MKAALVRLLRDEQGQDLVEYALIVAAVGLALITTVNQLSAGTASLYQSIPGALSSIGPRGPRPMAPGGHGTEQAERPAKAGPGMAPSSGPGVPWFAPDLAMVAATVTLFYCL